MSEAAIGNNGKVAVRTADIADAAGIIAMMKQITNESENLLFGKGEYDMSIEDEEAYIARMRGSSNSKFLIAEMDREIVGFITLTGESKPKVAHSGIMSIGVLKKCQGMGIAGKLLDGLISWAEGNGTITKINLFVRIDNEAAINLYKKKGFSIEGTLTRDFRINGEYFDSYLMGLWIN